MKLDRNITNPRRGKYALIKLRQSKITPELCRDPKACFPGSVMVEAAAIDFGDSEDTDFFVIRLKDVFAGPAIRAYARAISELLAELPSNDPERSSLTEYHHEIVELAELAHRNRTPHIPD